jgi:hypothetical protein
VQELRKRPHGYWYVGDLITFKDFIDDWSTRKRLDVFLKQALESWLNCEYVADELNLVAFAYEYAGSSERVEKGSRPGEPLLRKRFKFHRAKRASTLGSQPISNSDGAPVYVRERVSKRELRDEVGKVLEGQSNERLAPTGARGGGS